MKNSHLVSGFIFRLFLCPAKEKKILDAKMDIFYNLPTGLYYNYGKFAGDDAGIADLQVPAFILPVTRMETRF